MKKGVDLSTWQTSVNYKKLKEDGIEFAILRCGYGKDAGQKDDMFEIHYQGCKEAGIKVGAYHYSYCTSVDNAINEAENCLSYIQGKEFDLPVFLDLEEERTRVLGIDQITQIALIFCRKIKEAGYKAGVYANLYWFNNFIRHQALSLENFSLWVAQWNNNLDATFPVDIWQFTNNIDDKGIDGNYLINEKLLENTNPEFETDINKSLAVDVIFGKYENGEERKNRLGKYYYPVQDIVNKIYDTILPKE